MEHNIGKKELSTKKRIFILFVAVCLVFSSTVLTVRADATGASQEIIIYHTNDTHGYLYGDGESIIGIDTVAALKKTTPGSILIDAGDAT